MPVGPLNPLPTVWEREKTQFVKKAGAAAPAFFAADFLFATDTFHSFAKLQPENGGEKIRLLVY